MRRSRREDGMVTRALTVMEDLDLLLLGAPTGSVIEVTAEGEDEELATAAISALVLALFGQTGLERGN